MGKRKQRRGARVKPQANGRVTARLGPVLSVESDDGQQLSCLARGRAQRCVVGDRIFYEEGIQADLAEGLITWIAPRRSTLLRTDALGRREQVLAANLDHLYIITAVEPPFRLGLIDRYLVAARSQGISASIIFNKSDLLLDEEEQADYEEELSIYPGLGHPVYFVSATQAEGLEPLAEALQDQLSIFVGHSGVGKTSLLNALDPGLGEKVRELSCSSGRGQHTTSTSALFRLPGGGEVIDSPGIRSFGLWGIKVEDLRLHFPEFLEWSSGCRFANCGHIQEPACAVKAALEEGKISENRYTSYLRIRESLEGERFGSAHDYFDF